MRVRALHFKPLPLNEDVIIMIMIARDISSHFKASFLMAHIQSEIKTMQTRSAVRTLLSSSKGIILLESFFVKFSVFAMSRKEEATSAPLLGPQRSVDMRSETRNAVFPSSHLVISELMSAATEVTRVSPTQTPVQELSELGTRGKIISNLKLM